MVRFGGVAALVCMLASVASAETPQQQADRLFTEGRTALNDNPKRACELFEEAIKIDVSATGTMLNLGLCYEKLGKYASSLFWFRKAQVAASENRLADYEAAAKEHTGLNYPKVSTLTISVVNGPSAEVRVDGKRIEPTTYGKVEVDSGEHEVTASASGKALEKQTITIKEAENQPVTITMRNEYVVDRGKNRRLLAYVAGGVGVASLVGLGVWGIVSKSQYDDAGEAGDIDKQNMLSDRMKYGGTTVFIVGSALVAGAAVLYFTAPGKESVVEGTAFAPIVTSDQVGLAASGSF